MVRGDFHGASGYGDPLGVNLLTGNMGMDEGEFVGTSGNAGMGERPCTVPAVGEARRSAIIPEEGEGATG